ncbi:hypothetical protein HanXRQr2_Chr06g0265311 [Helianthus annuus]|uniref:Uncharacterized protein n=1 Tax=Helianthus annuus TaxID=4232 RepID=A0A9K3ITS6_HELAN|nr:hypothetical protein HanXRQr2_Chr06g0265311 [Helianthus annuus]KAJ0560975.1 hypothetical protein HanHA300_Chr06g0217531 [Helianthus annuus]KAJ0567481.1 hypothetical protein HanIR_Chr06g0285281 [Helianthus annuus]KAJ0574014.1 hypothetical protein HanHA89_Chr06g0233331 [Helianthus annuus]KAJ0738348.1 hypothetical protein HanLR1_Chr06g0217261 [Helianthus annuus]
MCYIQAMPMRWRVLYTIENIIEQEGIEIGMSELDELYNLVNHGSHRFLFKHKPGDPHPVLKTTKNDPQWRNRFFFVRRDSIPDGKDLPKKWATHGAGKSSKSASRFSVSVLDAFASSRSGKKHLAASPSIPAPKAVSTKGKGGKKRKTAETLEGLPLIQYQFEEYVSEVRIPDP